MSLERNKGISIFISGVMLLMILSRLVWMQVRNFDLTPNLSSFASLQVHNGFFSQNNCSHDEKFTELFEPIQSQIGNKLNKNIVAWFVEPIQLLNYREICLKQDPIKFIIQSHWVILILTVLSACFLTRFLINSWTLAIFVAAVLMSRGRLLSLIGSFTEYLPLTLLFTLWFTFCVHHMRTLSYGSLLFMALISIIGTMYNISFAFLFFVIPIAYFVRKELIMRPNEDEIILSPGPFQSIPIPYFAWLKYSGFKSKVLTFIFWSIVSLNVFLMLAKFSIYQQQDTSIAQIFSHFNLSFKFFSDYFTLWLGEVYKLIDLHYFISLAMIIFWMCSKSNQGILDSRRETGIIFFTIALMLMLISFFTGFLDFYMVRNFLYDKDPIESIPFNFASFILWIEPVILTMGIIFGYDFIRREIKSYE